MKHQPNCNWEKSNCEYKSTHEYCPHAEHACSCISVNQMIPEFHEFKKIPRLSREIIITEKIDGTNGVIYINDEGTEIYAGSKSRWLDDHNDNFGFWHWVMDNKEELMKLGKGYHYGEYWGKGIQRNYGLDERRFSLFNCSRWVKDRTQTLLEKQEYCPECCYVVPMLYSGLFDTNVINGVLGALQLMSGSHAVPGFMKPEGVVIYHIPSRYYFKKTIENDEKGKEQ